MTDTLTPEQTAALKELQRRRGGLNPNQRAALDELVRRSDAQEVTAGAGQTPLNPTSTPMGRFGDALWESIDPVKGLQSAAQATAQPLEALRGIGEAQAQLLTGAREAWAQGDYGTALRKGMHYLLPILGPGLEQSAEELATGKTAEGLGHMAGLGVQAVPPAALSRIPQSVRIPVPGMSGLNAAEKSAIDMLTSRGVPVPAGTQGGTTFSKGLQKLAGVTPAGAHLSSKMDLETTSGLQRVAGELGRDIHPQTMIPESAGQSVMTELLSRKMGLENQADTEYQVLRDLEADPASLRNVQTGWQKDTRGRPVPLMEDVPVPVDIRSLKSQLRPIYEHMSQWIEPAQRNASAGYQALKTILESKQHVPATIAEAGLGGLKQLAREGSGRAAGLAKYVIPKFEELIDNAVQAIEPNALTSLRNGRQLTAQSKGTEEVLKRVSGVHEEPVAGFGRLTQPQDTGIYLLRQLEQEAPGELPKVGRAYFEKLIDVARLEGGLPRHADKIFAQWQQLGEETKRLMYPNPMLRQNLNDFFLGMKKLAENPNPSGTAIVSAISGQATTAGAALATGNPVWAFVTMTAPSTLAALMYTPKGASLLKRGINLPARSLAAAAVAGELQKLAGEHLKVSAEDDMPAPSGINDEEKIRRQMGGRPMLPAVTR